MVVLTNQKTLVRTDRIILQRLFIASAVVALSVFTIPLDLIESEEDLKHNPKFLRNSQPTSGSQWASKQNIVPYESKYHVVFSTGCSNFQDWQSYVFFYHVLQSGQEGHVTRIVSGCNESQKQELEGIFETEVASLAPGRFHLHHTPDYSRIKQRASYVYFNKPYGMRHWMEHVLGYPDPSEEQDDDIIMLLDPDQIIKRPFTAEFKREAEDWKTEPESLRVDHGSPFAQVYGFGLRWKTQIDLAYVFQNLSTPITSMTKSELEDYYHAMGPPFIATAKDMYSIVKVWSDVVPRVHDQFPQLLAEMYGYNLAAAHLGLRHMLAKSFMLSSVMTYRIEAWEKILDPLPTERICDKNLPQESYPHVLHFCQRYGVGKWFFNKKILPKTLLSCDGPLLQEPPYNLVDLYSSAIYPGVLNVIPLPMSRRRHESFMLCNVIRDLNLALVHYKQQHCASANYEYNLTFFENMTWVDNTTLVTT
ncbi:unnamed protein product [Cylindrotheca closterium]|uniref:Uncharacterized protein n=1 Tax=Cylindrotheca closterium TaxID=2856 RepID=A0AAD2JKM5_9STRA|nr:unnamed protein product [Cylindrotheca closterium]